MNTITTSKSSEGIGHGDPASSYALDLSASLAPPEHLWVNSGWSTVQPLPGTVCGVGGCFAPPFAAQDMRLGVLLIADGQRISDTGSRGKGDCGLLYSGGEWRPDRIERRGTYHWLKEEHLISLAVRSRLIPLHGAYGYGLEIEVRNRGDETVSLVLEPEWHPGTPGAMPLTEWTFAPPEPGHPVVQESDRVWRNEQVRLRMQFEGQEVSLPPGACADWRIAVGMEDPNGSAVEISECSATGRAWQDRLNVYGGRLPILNSPREDLNAYYRRGAISGLVCLWDHPDFALQPWPATCGMDGRAISAYVWDWAGYSPEAAVWILGDKAVDLLRLFDGMGLDRNNQLTPGGVGSGRWYAYNQWAFIRLGWTIALWQGVDLDLFDLMRGRFLEMDASLRKDGALADYGAQKNLLEMRGRGWEHITASPNAERAWGYERLADMADFLGQSGGNAWRAQAEEIRTEIRERLWDARVGWFRCLHPEGPPEIVYSIQAYDALRAGACDAAMEAALLQRLNEQEFLGPYGVSSVSKQDAIHYEMNDPDWSGSGAYVGELPQLALTLYEQGHGARAWDVLRRAFWMGQHLPYYPQEHYCDRPAVPAHKRGNIISGVAAVQAVVCGLFGARPQLDGTIQFHPQPPGDGHYELTGLRFRGKVINVELVSGVAVVRVC